MISWGRVKSLLYPDGSRVFYTYSSHGGELKRVYMTGQDIVSNITYDGFGNVELMEYGNSTSTDFTYNDYTRRLTEVQLDVTGARQFPMMLWVM